MNGDVARIEGYDVSAPTSLFIAGEWRESADSRRVPVVDPATGGILTTVASAGPVEAISAIDAAQAAAATWAATAPRHRSDVLMRAYRLTTERADELARLIVAENGKALTDARAEVSYAAEFFRWYAEETVRVSGSWQTAPGGAHRILVTRQPIGVSVLITPWNVPAAMATRKIAPALGAGCTVVLKPAMETPLTALWLAAVLHEAGAPSGVVNVVPAAHASEVVPAMLDHPAVRKLSFTGSTEVGRLLLEQAGRRVLSCSMELGGNAPFIVLEDADLDVAVEGAMLAKLRNGGEACTAANRFYVHASLAADFGKRLADAMGGLKVGPGIEPGVQVGPLVTPDAVGTVTALVDDAVDRGARIQVGGRAGTGPGYFFEPTVLTDVGRDSRLLAEEIFGPVAPIVAFDDVDDAVRMANDTEYGLVGYVFTRDLAAGMRVAEAVDAGMIGLNRGVVSDPAAPFGGTKQSGLGREGGHEGLLEYTESKYIAASW